MPPCCQLLFPYSVLSEFEYRNFRFRNHFDGNFVPSHTETDFPLPRQWKFCFRTSGDKNNKNLHSQNHLVYYMGIDIGCSTLWEIGYHKMLGLSHQKM